MEMTLPEIKPAKNPGLGVFKLERGTEVEVRLTKQSDIHEVLELINTEAQNDRFVCPVAERQLETYVYNEQSVVTLIRRAQDTGSKIAGHLCVRNLKEEIGFPVESFELKAGLVHPDFRGMGLQIFYRFAMLEQLLLQHASILEEASIGDRKVYSVSKQSKVETPLEAMGLTESDVADRKMFKEAGNELSLDKHLREITLRRYKENGFNSPYDYMKKIDALKKQKSAILASEKRE